MIFIFFSYRCVGRDGHQTKARVLRPLCWMQVEFRLTIFIIRVNLKFLNLSSVLFLKVSATAVCFGTEEERRHIVGEKRRGMPLLLLNKPKNNLTCLTTSTFKYCPCLSLLIIKCGNEYRIGSNKMLRRLLGFNGKYLLK